MQPCRVGTRRSALIGSPFRAERKLAKRSLSTWRRFTIDSDCIPRWAMSVLSPMSNKRSEFPRSLTPQKRVKVRPVPCLPSHHVIMDVHRGCEADKILLYVLAYKACASDCNRQWPSAPQIRLFFGLQTHQSDDRSSTVSPSCFHSTLFMRGGEPQAHESGQSHLIFKSRCKPLYA